MYCLDAKYMTCPPKDTEQLPPACNCCVAEKRGCTIYLSNGEWRNAHEVKSIL
jgi:hypothetical protein